MSSPRILLVAYQCAPAMGSVSQIGWEWYRRLAQRAPVTLVTHQRNRPALAAAGAPLADSEVIYIDTEWFAGPLYRAARRLFPGSEHAVFLVSQLDYFVFDFVALRALKRRAGQWDIVHRVTPVTPSAPTRLASLGLPTVIGPLNGGLPAAAPAFRGLAREDGAALRLLRVWPRLLDAMFGSTRRAARILSATDATRASVPDRHRGKVVPMLENGVDLTRFAATPWPPAPSAGNPLRVLFVGRMVPIKGVPMLLEALARVACQVPVQLDLIGDGPLRATLQQQARSLGLDDAVRFLGAADLDTVAQALRAAHVLCLPSVRESGGAVLLEAFASARPAIAIRFGGPGELVDEELGVAIAPTSHEAVVAEIAAALLDITVNPAQWRARGEAARARAATSYDWEAKIDAMLALYSELACGPDVARRAAVAT